MYHHFRTAVSSLFSWCAVTWVLTSLAFLKPCMLVHTNTVHACTCTYIDFVHCVHIHPHSTKFREHYLDRLYTCHHNFSYANLLSFMGKILTMVKVCMIIFLTKSQKYHDMLPCAVVPDLPLPGLTVSPPHCDPWLLKSRQLSRPTVDVCLWRNCIVTVV